MKLIEGSPPALPGSCYMCSSASRERYIDMETQVEFHGAMYLCELCATLVGRMVGMLSVEEYGTLKEQSVLQELQLLQRENQIRTLEKVIDGYDDVRVHFTGSLESPSDNLVPAVSVPEREESVAGGEDGPAGQGNVEGVVDVPESERESEDDFSF